MRKVEGFLNVEKSGFVFSERKTMKVEDDRKGVMGSWVYIGFRNREMSFIRRRGLPLQNLIQWICTRPNTKLPRHIRGPIHINAVSDTNLFSKFP